VGRGRLIFLGRGSDDHKVNRACNLAKLENKSAREALETHLFSWNFHFKFPHRHGQPRIILSGRTLLETAQAGRTLRNPGASSFIRPLEVDSQLRMTLAPRSSTDVDPSGADSLVMNGELTRHPRDPARYRSQRGRPRLTAAHFLLEACPRTTYDYFS
jgi:hypothetical protein